ncbi:MAG: SDR family NAD(P)-dependent oxidoreductase [Candidatus Dormibacteraeota bacterium]|nr:SDR family NAD(P)-dependent oxidoreductase [Candidatus Dormibacteraeota bacterium]MBO0745089.1 SDR family NAD(P)-dependent oxidoreductase [Candidatus Dormibacteraeota bacterium]
MAGALDGKHVIVTGASRGIGVAIARRFAAEGAAVVVTARSGESPVGGLPGTIVETARSIRDAGGRAVPIAADLSVAADRERLVAEAEQALGAIDILVNNAAVTWFEPVATFNLRHYDVMFEVQVKAAVHLAQLVLPTMRERGRGWICNISSGAARHPRIPPSGRAGSGTGTVYGMCKAALERFSTGLAAEVYGAGVAVNALSPARVVPTPGTLFHGLVTEGSADAEPAEVMAAAALALCSGDGAVVTGRVTTSRDLLTELGIAVPAG